jgi:hypothetical protein
VPGFRRPANNSWWLQVENVDFNFYKTAGVAFDGNMNAGDFRNCSMQHIGTSAATTPTGGILTSLFTGATSAAINFYNCSIDAIYGAGIANGQAGQPIGYAVNLYGCQIWNVFTSAWATYTGFGLVIQGTFSTGKCSIVGCWFGTNSAGDLWLNGGSLVATDTTFTSATAGSIANWGNLTLIGCDIYSTTANGMVNNGSVNCIGCTLRGSATALYSGGPTAAQCLGIATSVGLAVGATAVTVP